MLSIQIDNPTIEKKLLYTIQNQKRGLEDIVIEAIDKFLNSNEKSTQSSIDTLPSLIDKYIGIVKADEIDEEYQSSREVMLKEKYL